jgi:hypothetical protein
MEAATSESSRRIEQALPADSCTGYAAKGGARSLLKRNNVGQMARTVTVLLAFTLDVNHAWR